MRFECEFSAALRNRKVGSISSWSEPQGYGHRSAADVKAACDLELAVAGGERYVDLILYAMHCRRTIMELESADREACAKWRRGLASEQEPCGQCVAACCREPGFPRVTFLLLEEVPEPGRS